MLHLGYIFYSGASLIQDYIILSKKVIILVMSLCNMFSERESDLADISDTQLKITTELSVTYKEVHTAVKPPWLSSVWPDCSHEALFIRLIHMYVI